MASLWSAVKPDGACAWFVRRGALHFLMPYSAYHLLTLPAAHTAALLGVAEGRLYDSAIEVQEVGAGALASALAPLPMPTQARVGEKYLSALAAAKLPKRLPAPTTDPASEGGAKEAEAYKAYKAKLALAVRRRLGACLALGAVIKAHPFDVPSHLPPALAALARAANEAAPVGPAVQKVIADFRLTHQDSWASHKEAFAEDQLADLSAVGSGASYFA